MPETDEALGYSATDGNSVDYTDAPDGTASTVEPDAQPGVEPQPDGQQDPTVTLCVAFGADTFVGFDAAGNRHVVSRDGSEVPASEADSLIQTAATVGIHLTVKD